MNLPRRVRRSAREAVFHPMSLPAKADASPRAPSGVIERLTGSL
jgi:hypothetical protein